MQVYDLAWSPTGEYIIAGSTDNTARIFSANDGTRGPLSYLTVSAYTEVSSKENAYGR